MWFELIITSIGIITILIIIIGNKLSRFSFKGTRTPDIFKRYVYDYIPRMINEHNSSVIDYYLKMRKDSHDDDNNEYNENNVNNNNKGWSMEHGGDSRGEKECRRVLEKIFNKPFGKSRPSFLNNDITSSRLELDCFNPELKLACEYQGEAHYRYIPYFHKNLDSFRNQQYRDYMKRQKCKENDINLIEIPFTVGIKDIETYITKELERLNINQKENN